MTYNVSSGTLNSAIPYQLGLLIRIVDVVDDKKSVDDIYDELLALKLDSDFLTPSAASRAGFHSHYTVHRY